MKLSFGAIVPVTLTLLFGLFGEGEAQGNGQGQGQVQATVGDPISGNFKFQFYRWTNPKTSQVHHLYPNQPITPGHINILESYINDFFYIAATAYHTAKFGSNNIAETDIISMNHDECRFTTDPFTDASFWCPATFTFTYINDIPEQVYSDLGDVTDMLSAHDFNRYIFGNSRYPRPLSNFINETLHQSGGFWKDIHFIGLCRHFACGRRLAEYTGGAFGAVARSIEELEAEEAMMLNGTIVTTMNTTMETEQSSSEGMMKGTTTMNTTMAIEESDGTIEVEDILGSSAPQTILSSLACTALIIVVCIWLF